MSNNLLANINLFGSVWSFAVAILVLLLMITVHEFGHYIVGKIFKFNIEEFSIGFGPAIFKKKKKDGEIFAVRLLPLGGYCSFGGEETDAVKEGDFNSKPPYQRILVLIAGATMNLILAVVVAGLSLGIYGTPVYKIVETDGHAMQHFMAEDVILSAEGENVYATFTELSKFYSDKTEGDTVKFKVLRNGKVTDVNAVVHETGDGVKFGITISSEFHRLGFFETFLRTFEYTFKMGLLIMSALGSLITGAVGLSAVGGTVTTITETAKGVQEYGLPFLLQITSLIGVNLGLFNLLPIPALDGSKVVFTAIEWVRGKPINRKVEAVIHFIGFVLLIGFAIIVDLQHYI